MIAGLGSPIDHVAVVVRDIDQATKRYWEEFGIGPWVVHTFTADAMPEMTFRGKSQAHAMPLAIADGGGARYELVQPLQGPSTYEEFLAEHGACRFRSCS